MVKIATLKKKSINELKSIKAYNELKIKELLKEIEDIETVLTKKSLDEVVLDGLYILDDKQDIIVKIIDSKINYIYNERTWKFFNRPISVRFEKGEMVCTYQNKKRKLNFIFKRELSTTISSAVCILLTKANNEQFINDLVNKFQTFLNYKTQNSEVCKIQNLFTEALFVVNKELSKNYTYSYTFDQNSLFKLLDLKLVKQLIESSKVRFESIVKIWNLIENIQILVNEVYVCSKWSTMKNFKWYEEKTNKINYQFYLKDIVKKQKLNL